MNDIFQSTGGSVIHIFMEWARVTYISLINLHCMYSVVSFETN